MRATFDPVGSTATLVDRALPPERAWSRAAPTATLLLGAILSDTVILNSPTTTERDRAVVEYLERVLALDADGVRARDVRGAPPTSRDVPAEEIVARDAKEYEVGGGQTLAIAQVETVGQGLLERRDELLEAMRRRCASASGHVLYALMVTDILAKGTELLVAGDRGAARARLRRARPTTA